MITGSINFGNADAFNHLFAVVMYLAKTPDIECGNVYADTDPFNGELNPSIATSFKKDGQKWSLGIFWTHGLYEVHTWLLDDDGNSTNTGADNWSTRAAVYLLETINASINEALNGYVED